MIERAGVVYDATMKTLLALLSAATLGVAAWAVFSRNVLSTSVVWADTTATWIFVWTVMLGSAYAITRGGHMEIGIGKDALPPVVRKAVTVVGYVAVAVAALFLTDAGVHFVDVSGDTPSPAVGVTMKWVLLAFPVGGALMILAALERVVTTLRTPADALPTSSDDDGPEVI